MSFRLCGQLVIILSDKDSITAATLEQRTLIGRHTMLTNHLLAQGYGKPGLKYFRTIQDPLQNTPVISFWISTSLVGVTNDKSLATVFTQIPIPINHSVMVR